MTTVPNSVRVIAPVGQTSRQPACVQCLQTSEDINHRKSVPRFGSCPSSGFCCSMNATCRHVFAFSSPVLSYEWPVKGCMSSGTKFHSLHATSHALQPMQTVVSVKKPTRCCVSLPYVAWPSPCCIARLL